MTDVGSSLPKRSWRSADSEQEQDGDGDSDGETCSESKGEREEAERLVAERRLKQEGI